MRFLNKKLNICLLFCIIFIILLGNFVVEGASLVTKGGTNPRPYFDDISVCGFISFNSVPADDPGSIYIGTNDFQELLNGGGQKTTFSSLGNIIKKDYADDMLNSCENDFIDLDFIDNVKITFKESKIVEFYHDSAHNDVNNKADGNYHHTHYDIEEIVASGGNSNQRYIDCTLITLPERLKEVVESNVTDCREPIIVDFQAGEKIYRFYTFTDKFYYSETTSGINGGVSVLTLKNRNTAPPLSFIRTDNSSFSNKDGVKILSYNPDREKILYNMAVNSLSVAEYLKEKVIEGIVIGSIGAGYNVCVPYSDKQVALKDVMYENEGIYEFYPFVESRIEFVLSYYYHPLFGKFYLNAEPKLPQSEDEWVIYAKDNLRTFIEDNGKGNSIKILYDFQEYAESLSEEFVNQWGEKIASTVNPKYGVKKIGNIGKNPKTVLSYNMQLAVPYLFTVNNNRGRLVTPALKILDDYTFCLYNNNLYKNSPNGNEETFLTPVGNMIDLRIDREHLYLYNQEVEISDEDYTKVGIVIVAAYDEAVADTTNYSENSYIYSKETKAESILLTGRKIYFDNGYSDNLYFYEENRDLMSVLGNGGKEGFLPLNVAFPAPTMTLQDLNVLNAFTGWIDNNINRELSEEVKKVLRPKTNNEMYSYIYDKTNHGEAPKNLSAVFMFIDIGEIKLSDDDPSKGRLSIYIVRNNAYVYDESLLAWLRSDSARALTYVDADRLISKITGDFSSQLKKITYAEWKEMQNIKSELNGYKERSLTKWMILLSGVFGVFLIIFAVFFVVAYWIDVLNPFTKFSILFFISMGNLYPISSDDMKQYVNPQTSNTKLVNFKQVCIIAAIMLLVGYMFIKIDFIFFLIIQIYRFVLRLLGGVW